LEDLLSNRPETGIFFSIGCVGNPASFPFYGNCPTQETDFVPLPATLDYDWCLSNRTGGSLRVLTEVENNIPPGAYFSRNVNCSGGKKAVGGGGAASTREVKIWQSSPSGIGWRIQGKNDYPGTIPVPYYVICICAN
jgi:hypothetical protein